MNAGMVIGLVIVICAVCTGVLGILAHNAPVIEEFDAPSPKPKLDTPQIPLEQLSSVRPLQNTH